MQILWLLLGFVCGIIPTLNAHPVSSLFAAEPHGAAAESYPPGWFKYVFGSFAVVIVAFTIIGCLCCKRHRHPKGFQALKSSKEQFKRHIDAKQKSFNYTVNSIS